LLATWGGQEGKGPKQTEKKRDSANYPLGSFNCKSAWQPGHKCKELNSTRVLDNSNPDKDLLESIFEKKLN
jgi:hypothetical protein